MANQADSITESIRLLKTTPEDVLSAGRNITKSEMFLPEIRVRFIYCKQFLVVLGARFRSTCFCLCVAQKPVLLKQAPNIII